MFIIDRGTHSSMTMTRWLLALRACAQCTYYISNRQSECKINAIDLELKSKQRIPVGTTSYVRACGVRCARALYNVCSVPGTHCLVHCAFLYLHRFFDFFFGFCTFCTSFNFTQSDVFVEVIATERFSHIIKISRNLMDIVVVNGVVINSNPFVILNHPVVQEKK